MAPSYLSIHIEISYVCSGYHRLLMATGGLHDQAEKKEAHAYESRRITIDDLGFYFLQNP